MEKIKCVLCQKICILPTKIIDGKPLCLKCKKSIINSLKVRV